MAADVATARKLKTIRAMRRRHFWDDFFVMIEPHQARDHRRVVSVAPSGMASKMGEARMA